MKALCALAFLLLASSNALAAPVTASATAIVDTQPGWFRDGTKLSLTAIELVSLSARGLESSMIDDLGVYVSAWGGLQSDRQGERAGEGDVDVAFVEGRVFRRHLRLRLGRQLVTGGVARTSFIDGVRADIAGPAGFGLSTSFGMPVARAFKRTFDGIWSFDSRLSWAPLPYVFSLGAAYSHTSDRGTVERQEVGLDGRWMMTSSLTLVGAAMFDTSSERFSEIDVGPRWVPLHNLELAAGYRRTAPDLLLPRSSIFTVFADGGRDELGGSVYFEPFSWLGLVGDGRAILVASLDQQDSDTPVEREAEASVGVDASLRATVRPDPNSRAYFALTGRVLRTEEQQLTGARASTSHVLWSRLSVTADLDAYWLERALNDQNLSLLASLTLGLPIGDDWRLGATVLGGTTPTFESLFEARAKLTYVFSSGEQTSE